MSLRWPREARAGLCPDALVLAGAVHGAVDPVAELERRVGKARVAVILSNHFVKYSVLPWSAALRSAQEWVALAQHGFQSVYGAACERWRVVVSGAAKGEPRMAAAVDGALIDRLRALPQVVSIQPWLMSAFNAQRRALGAEPAWLVMHEPGRLTLALAGGGGAWRSVRSRKVQGDWRDALADLLEREAAAAEAACERALVWSDEPPPANLGRFRLADATPAAGGARRHPMVH